MSYYEQFVSYKAGVESGAIIHDSTQVTEELKGLDARWRRSLCPMQGYRSTINWIDAQPEATNLGKLIYQCKKTHNLVHNTLQNVLCALAENKETSIR